MAYLTASDLLPAHAENFERFAKRVDGQCWTWTGPMDRYGYGSSRAKAAGIRQGTSAHRVAYLLLRGDIAPGQVIDHLCRNRWCVNPSHLEMVTNQDNVLRGLGVCASNARKTHCKHGHEFSPDNTLVGPKGYRRCRACRDEYNRRVNRSPRSQG